MSTCVLCKPSHHGSHPPPPHPAHTQARGPYPNHPWPGQAQSGPTPHPRATAIKPVNPKLAQGADPDRPSYPEDTPIKAPALSTSMPAPHEWQLRGPLLCLVHREQIVILQAWIRAWAKGATLAGTQGWALSWTVPVG